ncbi:MAG TPA: hypothetical protein VLB82_14325 [Thermodesulfobacteriota bacterium]|nr:hypothetical protein [Thermodesulfobacteriota bacterium]
MKLICVYCGSLKENGVDTISYHICDKCIKTLKGSAKKKKPDKKKNKRSKFFLS